MELGDGEAVRDSETAELARLADVAGLESARRRAAELAGPGDSGTSQNQLSLKGLGDGTELARRSEMVKAENL